MNGMLQDKTWYRNTFIALLILLVVVCVLVRWRLDPITAKGADVPLSQFSATRAVTTLATILGDERPHPVDSQANGDVRQRIIGTLQALGYDVEVQDTFACQDAWGATCARVRNVVAFHSGSVPVPAIMLTAHYDSVPAGPGASDDGSGVAVLLEVARMLKARAPSRNSVMLLFTDGEEAGLLGARAFAAGNPLMNDVALVINLEARGTTGQSVMFQTGENSDWLVKGLAATSQRPMTNSMSSEVYKLLPNDTDFTVFNKKSIPGLNFAFIDGLPFYHTPKDNLQSLDRGSLQQHGDNIYGLLGALLDADLTTYKPKGDRVYTDILGIGVIGWSASLSLAIGLGLLSLYCLASVMLKRRHPYPLGSVVRGFAGFVFAILLGAVTAWLLATVLAAINGQATAWHTSALANRMLLWTSVLLAAVWAPMLLVRSSNPIGVWVGVGVGWLLLGSVSAVLLPGVSYPYILVSGALVVTALLAAWTPSRWNELSMRALFSIPALLAFFVVVPLIYGFEVALTFSVQGAIAMGIFMGLAGTLIIPLGLDSSRGRIRLYTGAAMTLVFVVSAIISIAAPAYSDSQPQPLNIKYTQDANSSGHVYASTNGVRLPAAVKQALGAQTSLEQRLPWSPVLFYGTPVSYPGLPVPHATIVSQETAGRNREVSIKLDIGPSAMLAMLWIPKSAGLKSIEISGQTLHFPSERSGNGDYESFVCRGESCDGMVAKLTLTGNLQHPALIVKAVAGIPSEGQSIIVGRNNSHAIAGQDGDQSLVWNKFQL